MAAIIHYSAPVGEYIVMTEDEVTDALKEKHLRPGYVVIGVHEIEFHDTGVLPLDRELHVRS